MSHTTPARPALLLFFLFFLGLAVTLLAFVDLQWTHRLLVKDVPPSSTTSARRPQ
jgi:hypothetical protein